MGRDRGRRGYCGRGGRRGRGGRGGGTHTDRGYPPAPNNPNPHAFQVPPQYPLQQFCAPTGPPSFPLATQQRAPTTIKRFAN